MDYKKSYKNYKIIKKYKKITKKIRFFRFFLKKTDFLYILNDFIIWIIGIEEDDILPYEINQIQLTLTLKNNSVEISYGANEILKIFDSDYFPLEAQYFNCKKLNKCGVKKNKGKLKLIFVILCYNLLKNKEIKKLFKNKTVSLIIIN